MTDIKERVTQYIAIRDKIKALEAAHKEQLKPMKEALEQLGGVLMQFMTETGSDGIKTEAGTCYVTTRWSAALADADAFMRFVRETGNFDLLDRKANATAVRDYVEANTTLPPGVNLSSIQQVGVRRS
jgi:hypothetical protein